MLQSTVLQSTVLSVALAISSLATASRCAATPEPAQRADDFVDRIGVATHWSYGDTPYGFAYDKAKQLLGEAGIRHVRDGLHPRERDLFDSLGIKTTTIFGPPGPVSDIVQRVKDNRDFIAMIEGPNEVDIFPTSSNYKGKSFPQGAIDFQNDLYAALKADATTKDLPVIAPSVARTGSNLQLAPLHSFDYLVMHSYAGGALPSRSLYGYAPAVQDAARILGQGAVLKPVVVTESGYHTALEANLTLGGVQPGVSERAHAKYIPRHFAEYFNAGIRRTFVYEFLNEFTNEATNAEASFGLVRRDMTPKPAFNALKNLIALLREARWNPTAKQWEKPAFEQRALDFSLGGDTKNLHHSLLQKADGDFYLLLWQEVSSFDTQTQKDIENPPALVTLNIGTPLKTASIFGLNDGPSALNTAQTRVLRRGQNIQSLSLSVPDEVVVVKLTPQKSAPGKSLPAPANMAGTSTASSIALRWAPVRGASGYFVWRMGQYLGQVSAPNFVDKNLVPGAGYEYAVQAHDARGGVSAALSKVLTTRSEFPDLIVTGLSWTPARPKAGDAVTWRATIKNIGSGATPAGIVHGMAFMVDGVFVNWSDTMHDSLAPGATATLTASNGPQKSATWTATAGKHTLSVTLDDVNRINESNETNNTLQQALEVE